MTNKKPEAIDRVRNRPALASVSVRPKRSNQLITCHDTIGEKLKTFRTTGRILGACAVCAIIAVCTSYITKSVAESATAHQGQPNSDAAPIYGIEVPAGYRDWQLISVKRLTGAAGKIHQLRAELSNNVAAEAFRNGRLPFPDGSIIAALHWNEASSDADNKVLAEGFPGAGLESTFAGSAVNVQFMVKDSKKYAATGGWGFADFTNGKPGNEALHKTCFGCHEPAKDRDFVFTRYAPTP
jgi:hypothetical protein